VDYSSSFLSCCGPRPRSRALSAQAVACRSKRMGPTSIERARAAAGGTERVRFVAASTSTFDGGEGFDLITACDCIHDLASPLACLAR